MTVESQDRQAAQGEVEAREGVKNAVTGLLWAIDHREWDKVQSFLADVVRTDYTSLFGGSYQTQKGVDVMAGWRAFLPGFDSTQHLTGPILTDVQSGTAMARCAVTAVHRIGEAFWTVGGHYRMTLARANGGWVIAGITLENVYVQGDRTLPDEARRRVAAPKKRETRR